MWWATEEEGHAHTTTKVGSEYLHTESSNGGIKQYAPYNGYTSSSTRCEIVAALTAMLPPVPVHTASDSKALVAK